MHQEHLDTAPRRHKDRHLARALRALLRGKSTLAPVVENHRPGVAWRLARLLIASSRTHAFLDRSWIAGLLAATPRLYRRPLALRLLSLSPHYLVYQWTNKYPKQTSRAQILEHEYQRNALSRIELCDKLLKRFLRSDMRVLDFGCGPGFLAREVSRHVRQVIASDVSRGVIACAKRLNPAPNLKYVRNRFDGLPQVPAGSIDLVYSFAVFQHLLKSQTAKFFQEFARVLTPGGIGVCHTILDGSKEQMAADPSAGNWITRMVNLRMVYFTAEEITIQLKDAGFQRVSVIPIASVTSINDDIGKEHLVIFGRQ